MSPSWFIGLVAPVPEAVLAALPPPPPRVRLFHAGDLHLTVAFLGGVEEDAARAAWRLATTHAWSPISATLAAVVPMGPPARPSALSAELDSGREEARALMAALRDPCRRAAGLLPERRDHRPHITLARPQRRATDAERARAVAWARDLDLNGAPVVLQALALYTWAADRQERLFRVVEQVSALGR